MSWGKAQNENLHKPLTTGPTFGHKTCLYGHAQGKQTDLPSRLLWRGKCQRTLRSGVQWKLCLMQYLFHHWFINLKPLLPQLNLSQKAIMEQDRAASSDADQRLAVGLCLMTFPLDSWACVMACACAVIKKCSPYLCVSAVKSLPLSIWVYWFLKPSSSMHVMGWIV